MVLARRIYEAAPICVQHVLFNAEATRVYRGRYLGRFGNILTAAEARASWAPDLIAEYQSQRLRSFTAAIALEVPRHRPGSDYELPLDGVRDVSGLAEWCDQSDKDAVKANQVLFEAQVPPADATRLATGGTTGNPLNFESTRSAVQEQWAIWWRFRRALGIKLGTRCAHFGGQGVVPGGQIGPPYWRRNLPMALTYFSANHVNASTAQAYIDEIHRNRFEWIHGYPTVLVTLARHCIEQGITLDYPMTWVTTGAEALTEDARVLLKRVFGVEPRQHYGLAEAVANFSECVEGRLHVDEDFALVEFLPSEAERGLHRIVGTALSNRATAFVRYDTGDLARLADGSCKCGRAGRIVDAVEGRQADFLTLSSGQLVGPVNQIAKGLNDILHLQLASDGPDSVRALVVPSDRWDGDSADLVRQLVVARSTDSIHVDVEVISEPLRSAGGKVRSVVDLGSA